MARKNKGFLLSILLNVILLFYIIHQRLNLSCQADVRVAEKSTRTLYCDKFDQHDRLQASDLSAGLQSFDAFQDEIYDWDVCKSEKHTKRSSPVQNVSKRMALHEPVQYCRFEPRIEQQHQFRFFSTDNVFRWPDFSTCAILPPKNYQWPSKQTKFPSPSGESAVSWSNLGLKSFKDVILFNEGFPKNIYHFNALVYDIEQEGAANLAAQYIPFGKKIRTMLEIGGGGGSLAVSLNKRYDVTVINTIQPEFPYCEYITERGGLCMLLDSLRAMPFAKFSFDVIHHSWVYHSLPPAKWRTVLLEQNRLLRPGGYLWIQDGSSNAVLQTIKYLLVEQLGYRVLYKKEDLLPLPATVFFGSEPFESEWCFILVKPNRIKNDHYPCH